MKIRSLSIVLGLGILLLMSCSDKGTDSETGPGLAGFWTFEEQLGDTSYDKSGNGNHVGNTSPSPAWFVDPSRGKTFSSNGISNYLERIDGDLGAGFPGKNNEPSEDLSITAWVKMNALVYQMIASKDAMGQRSFNFSVISTGKLGVQIGVGNLMHNYNGKTVLATGTWFHVAMVYDKVNDSTFTISTYVNGALDSTETGVPGPMNSTSTAFRIGGRVFVGQLASFSGLMDDVRIFNRALSASEIKSQAN